MVRTFYVGYSHCFLSKNTLAVVFFILRASKCGPWHSSNRPKKPNVQKSSVATNMGCFLDWACSSQFAPTYLGNKTRLSNTNKLWKSNYLKNISNKRSPSNGPTSRRPRVTPPRARHKIYSNKTKKCGHRSGAGVGPPTTGFRFPSRPQVHTMCLLLREARFGIEEEG